MSELIHTPLTNTELCYNNLRSVLTRTEDGIRIYQDSNGRWCKHIYNDKGYKLSFESSSGYWEKYTRDNSDNLLTCESIHGFVIYITGDKEYGLYYEDGLYKAGCHSFTYEQAIEHWTERSISINYDVKARAVKFLAAIEKHHKDLS